MIVDSSSCGGSRGAVIRQQLAPHCVVSLMWCSELPQREQRTAAARMHKPKHMLLTAQLLVSSHLV
jgi:hypothetical protein